MMLQSFSSVICLGLQRASTATGKPGPASDWLAAAQKAMSITQLQFLGILWAVVLFLEGPRCHHLKKRRNLDVHDFFPRYDI